MRVREGFCGRAAPLGALLWALTPVAGRADVKPAPPFVTAPVAPAASGPATPAVIKAPAAPAAVTVAATAHPTAIVLLGADGTSYFRSGIRAATADADKLAAVPWLSQRYPDAVARVLPDGAGVLVRRDRRAADGAVLQRLFLIKPAAGGGVIDEALPFDLTAFATEKNLEGWRLRAISGLQVARGTRRALLRLTYEKIPPAAAPEPVVATPAPQPATAAVAAQPATPPAEPPANTQDVKPDTGKPQTAEPDTTKVGATKTDMTAPAPALVATREYLGWYDLDTRTFATIFEEPRLVGAELSADGRLIHVLAQRGPETADPTALVLNDEGKVQATPVLDALRAVGYLYRGWVDGRSMLLKKAGQDQIIVYDAVTDTVSAPVALGVFAASKAPAGEFALTWTTEPEDTAPVALGNGGATVPLDFEGPVTVAEWSADGRFALLLGARNERQQATKAWLLETEGTPRLREIVLTAPVSAARFLYEAL